ncbi:MAG: 30S ribosomal protein S10 [Halobacteriaceae archaeon]
MTTVTKLTLRSGDRAALDGVVDDLREAARRKGAELKGPHSDSPEKCAVPQYKRLNGDPADVETYADWEYTVYTRRLEIVGHDELVRRILDQGFPDSVHAEVEIERVRPAGQS